MPTPNMTHLQWEILVHLKGNWAHDHVQETFEMNSKLKDENFELKKEMNQIRKELTKLISGSRKIIKLIDNDV